ncbi:uncharacterized protein G2W53_010532 [Senna tora]|uniref:Uncharacterized protein n=1 Tax=Senna tora TaxID=362788 RepID=A0A834WZX9_9FABA|nr:uncharacterized protein G2W53_010532 [Senna tora]
MEMCVNRDEGEARVWVLDYWVLTKVPPGVCGACHV